MILDHQVICLLATHVRWLWYSLVILCTQKDGIYLWVQGCLKCSKMQITPTPYKATALLFIYLLFYLIADRYFGPVKTSSVWWITEYASRISWVAWVAHRVGSCHIFTSISRSPFLQFLCWRSRVLPLCRPWFIKLRYDLCCVLRGITRSRNAYVFSILFRGANAAPEASRARIRFPSYK